MKPQELQNQLNELLAKAAEGSMPVVMVCGILECAKQDIIFRVIRAAEQSAAMKFASEMAAKATPDIKGN